jgi:hypothetical protein
VIEPTSESFPLIPPGAFPAPIVTGVVPLFIVILVPPGKEVL